MMSSGRGGGGAGADEGRELGRGRGRRWNLEYVVGVELMDIWEDNVQGGEMGWTVGEKLFLGGARGGGRRWNEGDRVERRGGSSWIALTQFALKCMSLENSMLCIRNVYDPGTNICVCIHICNYV